MLPTPQVGQYVRLDDYGGRLIVKAVSEDGAAGSIWFRNVIPSMSATMYVV